jgi:predicted Zn finger-like uncharacterized protein
MSLATSCPSCGTIFKVVEDQLKVSEGWVRCGHCHEVFNALEGLFDLAGRQRPQPATRPIVTGDALPRRPVAPSSSGASTAAPRAEPRPPENPADWIETRPAMFSDVEALRAQQLQRDAERLKRMAVQGETESARSAVFDEAPTKLAEPVTAPAVASIPPPVASPTEYANPSIEFAAADESSQIEADPWTAQSYAATEFIDLGTADTIFEPHEQNTLFGDGLGTYQPLPPVEHDTNADVFGARNATAQNDAQAPTPVGAIPAIGGQSGSATLPAFVRQADRAAWWRKPAVRILLTLGSVCAALALLLQLALHQRDSLAARWPTLHAPLGALCEQLGCTLKAPQQLDALVVENTALTRPAGVDGYRLQVSLRNRVDYTIRAPHLELSLTDSSGAVIVRRVLSPADFMQAETLSASAEGNWQLELSSSDKRIAGYTVAAFYP